MKTESESTSRINVLGVGISDIHLDSAVAKVKSAIEGRRRGYICVTGVHGVSEAQEDPAFRQILNRSFLCTPDGMPMVWMGRLQGSRVIDRVYGPDLMERVLRMSAQAGFTQFLYGGADGVAPQLKEVLENRFPGLQIVGTYTPPFRPLNEEEEGELIEQVRKAQPDILWVGLSTPKQEKFMSQYHSRLDATLCFGVGAAFDFFTGRVTQAPRWIQRGGLEWLFRLFCEPRRLWKRYLKNNPLFVMRALAQLTGLRRYRID